MEGWLTFLEFKKITNFLDAFCGTVEPTFRNAFFYYNNSLRIFATDGCAELHLNATKEFLPFDGVAIVPVQYLKGIIKGTKVNDDSLVKISVEDDEIIFELEGMRLNSKIEKLKDDKIQKLNKDFTVLNRKKVGSFVDKMDFVSASASEGDVIDILTVENNILFGYICNFYKLNANFAPSKLEFHREIPFISARHIVKSLSLLNKNLTLEFGIDKNNIILHIPGVFIKICSTKPDYRKPIVIQLDYIEETIINTKDLKKALGKLYVTFTESNIANLVLKENNSYIYKEEQNSKISFKLPYSFKNQYMIPIHIRKLRSILSRMSENIKVYLNEREMILVDEKQNKCASFLVKEFKSASQ